MLKKYFLIICLLSFSIAFAGNDDQVKSDSLSVTEVLENIENLVDKNVSIVGTVDHVCKHGGKRLFVFDDNDPSKRFKVTAGPEIGTFKVEFEGSDVFVKGIIKETKVDETYLDNWESEINAEKPEIAHGGHENTAGKEEEHSDEAKESLEKIKSMREKLAKSEKGHLSFYEMECQSIQEIK